MVLNGVAAPGAVIRLASPGGSAITGSADRKGAFNIVAPGGPTPQLYSLSEAVGGRLARAVGYITVLPAPGPAAALLRPAAAAALPPAQVQRGVAAVDYDASGAAIASGRAAPGETVRLFLDGKDVGDDPTDPTGVFNASLSQPLSPGPHVLTMASPRTRASASFDAARTSSLAGAYYRASRVEAAWRIDWATPGGGVQSTILFDQRAGRG